MRPASLHDLLIARAFTSRLAAPALRMESGAGLTRRQFLSSTGSLSTAAYALTADPLSPHLAYQGKALVVFYAGGSWLIDPSFFGDRARVAWHRELGQFAIELKHAWLPGTDLDVSFRARLSPGRSGWRIALTIPAQSFQAQASLQDWMSGGLRMTSAVSTRTIALGGAKATFDGRSELGLDRAFGFNFSGAGPRFVAIDGPFQCAGSDLSLQATACCEGSLRHALLGFTGVATKFVLGAPNTSSSSMLLDGPLGRCGVGCCADAANALNGELFSRGRAREGIVVLEGPMRVFGHSHSPGIRPQVRLERAALMATTGRSEGDVALAGRVSRRPHAIEAAGCVLTICGDDERPFYLRVRDGVEAAPRVQVRLDHAWVPIAGADGATLSVPGPPVEIRLSEHAGLSPAASADAGAPAGLIVLGRDPFVMLPLGGANLTVSRGVDLLRLTFGFDGFDFKVEDGQSWLVRHQPETRGAKWPDATVTVTLGPQHVAEQFTEITLPMDCRDTSKFPAVSKARLSAPSRIVFALSTDPVKAEWKRQPLTIESLTEWSELALQVNSRAADPDIDLDAQLKLAGIDASTPLAELPARLAQQLQPPTTSETALTMSGRLVLSPSKSARWSTPRGEVDPSAAPLWHARLDARGRKTVRAIWSYFMAPGSFKVASQEDLMLPLRPLHHWDIVAQTSLYGLPALRRIEPNGAVQQGQAERPRSRVVRPDGHFCSLEELDQKCGYTNADSGLALPQPFEDADILLTSIGGSLVADWRGEPHALLYLDRVADATGFSLERLNYWSQLGRDIRVEAVDKGYVLPLGIRCSYVQLVERRFFRHPALRYPVAYLSKRRFIVFGKPQKDYPGEGQPFGGRDFPVRQLRMVTRKTPDLLPPGDGPLTSPPGTAVQVFAGGRLKLPNETVEYEIFWPRTRPRPPASTGDVEFSWMVDGEPTPVTSRLLFVENRAVSLERVMGKVVEYYRSLTDGEAWRRTATCGGARRSYAPALEEGDTSFDTDSWLLSCGGRLMAEGQNEEIEKFSMDARMEGSDQPPFYPNLQHALVNVQTLDRLLGRPQGLIRVGFTPQYVRHGFNTSANPSEIYLSVLSPDIALDVTSRGATTGGLAKPNALVVALSRKKGPVGGTRTAPANAAADVPLPQGRREVGASSPYDFRQALAGRFDPSEFLGGLGNAKLLGLIPLTDVLGAIGFEGAPKLLERIGYGPLGQAADAALAFLKRVLSEPVQENKTFLQLVKDAIGEILALQVGIPFQDLYPVLYQRLTAFRDTLGRAEKEVAAATELGQIFDVVTAVVRDGRALVAEIERTLQYPLPAVAQTALNSLSAAWTLIKEGLNGQYLAFGRQLHEQIVRAPLIDFCELVTRERLGGVLFGSDPALTCEYIVDNPGEALKRASATLFAEQFSEPLLRMLTSARGYRAEVTALISWAETEFVELARASVGRISALLQERLRVPLDAATQARVVEILLAQFREAVRNAGTEGAADAAADQAPIEVRLEEIVKALDTLQAQIVSGAIAKAALDKVIEEQPDLLQPKRPEDAAQLAEEFARGFTEGARDAADRTIGTEVRRVRALIVSRLQQARGQAIERVLLVVEQAFDATASSVAFAQITAAARTVAGWCGHIAGQVPAVFDVADTLATGLIAQALPIKQTLAHISNDADGITIPQGLPPDVEAQIARSLASLKAAIQQVAGVTDQIEAGRKGLADLRRKIQDEGLNVCASPGSFLDPVGRVLALRRDAVERVRDLLDKAATLDRLLSAPLSRDAAPAGFDAAVSPVFMREAAELLQQVTSLGEAAFPGTWTQLKATLEALGTGSPAVIGEHVQRLRTHLASMESRATALRESLASAADAATLRTVASEIVTYAIEHDKRLAALVLQTVALSQELERELDVKALAILRAVARPMHDVHAAAVTALDAIIDVLRGKPVNLLINPSVTDRLSDGRAEVQQDLAQLRRILDAASSSAAAVEVRTLLDMRWRTSPPRPPALVRVVAVLADLVETVLKGDLASIANLGALKQILEPLEARIRQILKDLVPTRIHLSYAWQTSLGPAPKSAPVFRMLESAPDDLVLTADISVDVLEKTQTAIVRGAMKPFQVHLLGPSLDIATIRFSGASFESRNGAAPAFAAEVRDVELGTLVQFIKPLQKWLSPEGDGFYVKPVFNPPGLEAGYTFDTDVIPLGAILFVNVALGVSARLPLTDSPATFRFNFASPERPFMIVAPPYGGGGYLSLVSNSGRIVEFRLSFVFGAVVPIKFGPLSAQGRVVAGIYVIHRENGERVIGALVEAAGEGHIACFSISVCLRVGLEQRGNALIGFSEFSFEFSVGIATLTFRFRATYTARNDRSDPLQPAADVEALVQGRRVVVPTPPCVPKGPELWASCKVITPRKASRWAGYRTRIATDLI